MNREERRRVAVARGKDACAPIVEGFVGKLAEAVANAYTAGFMAGAEYAIDTLDELIPK